ncbi:MAG: sodium-dependent bicarbonate transport family permease [Armatimonadota bacterium]|nr:MAG: sodium-dependent bicarbonate transport family permease [Armatimonadota bacterium]
MDPVILFFILGLAAGAAKADLRLPPAIYDFLSAYLLLAIGLKGGIELSTQSLGPLIPKVIVVMFLASLLPLLAYPVLRLLGRLGQADAASVAAHYGSVSVGTYAVAVAFLSARSMSHESYMPLFLALMEMPAIVVGILLARGITREVRWGRLLHEVFLGKAVVLLSGGLLIGWAAGPDGFSSLEAFYGGLFRGLLSLFLLEMGLLCAGQIGALRGVGAFLVAFGILTPVVFGLLGCAAGTLLMNLSAGGAALLGVLAASASYIAVPAAMRISVPEANPAISLAAALGVTFPFNVTLGIPLYVRMAQWMARF